MSLDILEIPLDHKTDFCIPQFSVTLSFLPPSSRGALLPWYFEGEATAPQRPGGYGLTTSAAPDTWGEHLENILHRNKALCEKENRKLEQR